MGVISAGIGLALKAAASHAASTERAIATDADSEEPGEPAFPLQHDSPMYDLSSAPKDAAAGMQTETFIRTTNLLPGGIESLQGTPTGGTETDNNLGDVDMDAKIQPTFFSKHLGQPIIIPQPMLDNDNTDWIKYHIGALEGCGIDRETVLGFALAFDKARKESPDLKVVNIGAYASASVSSLNPTVMSMDFTQAVQLVKVARSTHKLGSLLEDMNRHIFQPHGLYAMVAIFCPERKDEMIDITRVTEGTTAFPQHINNDLSTGTTNTVLARYDSKNQSTTGSVSSRLLSSTTGLLPPNGGLLYLLYGKLRDYQAPDHEEQGRPAKLQKVRVSTAERLTKIDDLVSRFAGRGLSNLGRDRQQYLGRRSRHPRPPELGTGRNIWNPDEREAADSVSLQPHLLYLIIINDTNTSAELDVRNEVHSPTISSLSTKMAGDAPQYKHSARTYSSFQAGLSAKLAAMEARGLQRQPQRHPEDLHRTETWDSSGDCPLSPQQPSLPSTSPRKSSLYRGQAERDDVVVCVPTL